MRGENVLSVGVGRCLTFGGYARVGVRKLETGLSFFRSGWVVKGFLKFLFVGFVGRTIFKKWFCVFVCCVILNKISGFGMRLKVGVLKSLGF